jgi:hypothetical protein
LSAGAGIWNKYVEEEVQKRAGKPQRPEESRQPEVAKPPKSFKKMSMSEYQRWRPPVAGLGG